MLEGASGSFNKEDTLQPRVWGDIGVYGSTWEYVSASSIGVEALVALIILV